MAKKFILFILFALSVFAQSNFEKAALKFLSSEERDQEAAIKLCEKACYEDGVATACYIVAKKQEEGYMRQDDPGKIFKLYEKACGMGEIDACKSVGDIYKEGRGSILADQKKAREIYAKACKAGLGDACFELGHFYRHDKDIKKSVELYEFACRHETVHGCYMLAQMYESGNFGLQKDIRKTLGFFMEACDGGIYEACEEADRVSKTIGSKRR